MVRRQSRRHLETAARQQQHPHHATPRTHDVVLGAGARSVRRRSAVAHGAGDGRSETESNAMTARLGAKVRMLRRKEGLSQTDLAARLEISPSYLNLIEHNQRPPPAHLLVRVAQTFKVDLATFADDSQARLAADLQEGFGEPLFGEHALTTNDMREMAENAAASRAVIALYHAYRAQTDSVRALATKVYDGRDIHGVNQIGRASCRERV